jgi:uracil-DNA glycosylase
MDNRKTALAALIRRHARGDGLLMWRGEEERAFLLALLNAGAPGTGSAPVGLAPQASLQDEIRTCARCHATGERRPPFGTGGSGVMIMLNPPSMMGRAERAAYRKESAELLRKMCASIRLDIEQCYVTGTIKCDPGGAAISPGAMLAQCEHILERELGEIHPRFVLVMGDILPLKRVKDLYADTRWFAVEHPVALIKNPDLKKRAWTTLQLLRKALDETNDAP